MSSLWRSFAREESGSLIPMTAAAMMTMIFAVGGAIDYSNAVAAKKTASNALDSATLMTVRRYSAGKINENQISDYLNQAFFDIVQSKNGVSFNPPEVSYDAEIGEVMASVSGTVETAFAKIAGFHEMNVGASASAVYSQLNLELSLVVDVTGSMAGSRIETLKVAATDLVETLLTDEAIEENSVRISIVPYSEGVKAGDYWDDMVSYMSSDQQAGLQSDVLPFVNSSKFCFTERQDGLVGDYSPQDAVFGTSIRAGCPSSEIIPLTNDRQLLLDEITSFSATGLTAGQTGIQWGLNMLSPKWASFWPAASQPSSYDDVETKKVVIIMTDGDFNTYYDNSSSGGYWVWRYSYWSGWYTVWIEPAEFPNQDEFAGSSAASGESRHRARQTCDIIDNLGVEVYTVAFEAPSGAQAIMQDCASSIDNYYNASDDTSFIEAFALIAGKIRKLHLSS